MTNHHYTEISTKNDNANWFFQDTGEKLGKSPLYNVRNQNLDGDKWKNANYLNYKNKVGADGHHFAEICPDTKGANWFFELDKSSYSLQVSISSVTVNNDSNNIVSKNNDAAEKILSSETSIGSHTIDNTLGNSPLTETYTIEQSYEASTTYEFNVECTQSFTVIGSVQESVILEKATAEIKDTFAISEASSWTTTHTKSHSMSATASTTVAPGKCSVIKGSCEIITASNVGFTATALVSVIGTTIDENGNIVSGQAIANTEFIKQYINDNVNHMTVATDQTGGSDTQIEVSITGTMHTNYATDNTETTETACTPAPAPAPAPEHSEL